MADERPAPSPADSAADAAAGSGASRSPFARRGFVAGAVLVALLIAAVVWLAMTGPGHTDRPGAAPSPGSAAPTVGRSACGLPGGDQTPPAVAPDTHWVLVGTIAAPHDPATAGPATSRNGVGVCYAPTPVGALYAAANFLAATSDPALRLPAAQTLTAQGPGRNEAIRLLQTSGSGDSGSGLQIAGFQFLGYTPRTSAVVDLALAYQGKDAHLPLQLRWENGDWKVVVPVTGRPFDGVQALPTGAAGYVHWQGA